MLGDQTIESTGFFFSPGLPRVRLSGTSVAVGTPGCICRRLGLARRMNSRAFNVIFVDIPEWLVQREHVLPSSRSRSRAVDKLRGHVISGLGTTIDIFFVIDLDHFLRWSTLCGAPFLPAELLELLERIQVMRLTLLSPSRQAVR